MLWEKHANVGRFLRSSETPPKIVFLFMLLPYHTKCSSSKFLPSTTRNMLSMLICSSIHIFFLILWVISSYWLLLLLLCKMMKKKGFQISMCVCCVGNKKKIFFSHSCQFTCCVIPHQFASFFSFTICLPLPSLLLFCFQSKRRMGERL